MEWNSIQMSGKEIYTYVYRDKCMRMRDTMKRMSRKSVKLTVQSVLGNKNEREITVSEGEH